MPEKKQVKSTLLAYLKHLPALAHIPAVIIVVGIFSFELIPLMQSVDLLSSSTAAIEYIFIPVYVAVRATFVAGVYYLLAFSLLAFRTARRIPAFILLSFFFVGVGVIAYERISVITDEKDLETVRTLMATLPLNQPELPPKQIEDIIRAYETLPKDNHYRALIPNALALRWDLPPMVLDRLAREDDKALYHSVPGPVELVFGNRRRIAVMRTMVAHANMPQKTLVFLANRILDGTGNPWFTSIDYEHREYVIGSIAQALHNENLLRRLFNSYPESWNVAYGLSNNLFTPGDVLARISKLDCPACDSLSANAVKKLDARKQLQQTCPANAVAGDYVRKLERCWQLNLPRDDLLTESFAAQHRIEWWAPSMIVSTSGSTAIAISSRPVSEWEWAEYCKTTMRCPYPEKDRRKNNKTATGTSTEEQQAFAQYYQQRLSTMRGHPITVRIATPAEVATAEDAGIIKAAKGGFRLAMDLDYGRWPTALKAMPEA